MLADLLLTGQFGYGSTKLLFLMLCLIIIFGLADLSRGDMGTGMLRASAATMFTLSLLVVSSHGYALSSWGVHPKSALSPVSFEQDGEHISLRLRDPLLLLSDYRDLHRVLEREGIYTNEKCDLDDLPRICLVLYTETRKVQMQQAAITRVNALSSGEIQEYICTRFLTEISMGKASNDSLQQRFFFKTNDGLRDSLIWLARENPNTRVLVAREGRNELEVIEVSKLATLSRHLYPDVPQCRFDFGTTDRTLNCKR